MVLVFYVGYQRTYLDPHSLETTGVGGTEQCLIHLATEFAKEHTVYITGNVENTERLGVKYRSTETILSDLGGTYIDCVIASSYIHYFLELDFLNFNTSMFWVHNTDFYPWFRGEELENQGRDYFNDPRMTHVVCLTEWHKKIFIDQFPESADKVIVIGNGVLYNSFQRNIEKRDNSFIYTSHSERGLDLILNEWPDIKKNIPNATLDIATPEYGIDFFNEHFSSKISELSDVKFHGSLSLNNLYDLMAKSKYWYYPTSYEETFCITALEMLGHNVTPIASETAGLKETLNNFNIKSLKNLNSDSINWDDVNLYVKKCDWSEKKTEWNVYISNMETNSNKQEIITDQMSTEFEHDEPSDVLKKIGGYDIMNIDLEEATSTIETINNVDIPNNNSELIDGDNLLSSVDSVEEEVSIMDAEEQSFNSSEVNIQTNSLNEEILNIDCVYIISENYTEDNMEIWTQEIRNKINWYQGPIVGKKLLSKENANETWYAENNYEFFEWKQPSSGIDWYNRELDYSDISLSISHHQIWVHAKKSEFQNIIILEDTFNIQNDINIAETLVQVPSDYDLFYLGRTSSSHSETRIDEDIVKPSVSYGSFAYMLSAKGIESLLQQNFNTYIMPISDFLISCYTKHPRTDLNFIVNDLIAYGTKVNLFTQDENNYKGPDISIFSSERKHPDLYTYWSDPDTWKKKFVAYAARTKEWELIIDEPFDNCFSMPLFTQEFCEKIREEAEHSNKWTTDRHEYYPTTDMLLEAIGFTEIYYEVLKEYVMPAAVHLYNLTSKGWDCMTTEDFLAKYIPTAQGHLSLHHDASDITALVTLSNFDEYEGGGTYFSHQKKLVKEQQGYVSIHPGNITHRHGARATTKGKRYIIVSFMSQNKNV